jgi:general secretion pathway protein G
MRIRLNKKGFTLIELLIVVAIIGIIAAIAIPNLLNAIQRGKQKRTMADMRSIATAIEAFSVDNNRYPQGGSPVVAIQSSVEPRYIKKLPTKDAWNGEYDYQRGPQPSSAQTYTLISYGKDNKPAKTNHRGSAFAGGTTFLVFGGWFMKMNQRGFTLIELLIVVAIIGIIVAIAVPNILDAVDRTKQRASVADMRTWGNAIGGYYSDKSILPPPGPIDTVRDELVPYAVSNLRNRDHWNNQLTYDVDLVAETYTVRSNGKDGVAGLGVTPTTWQNYDLDIVLQDGVFVNAPY